MDREVIVIAVFAVAVLLMVAALVVIHRDRVRRRDAMAKIRRDAMAKIRQTATPPRGIVSTLPVTAPKDEVERMADRIRETHARQRARGRVSSRSLDDDAITTTHMPYAADDGGSSSGKTYGGISSHDSGGSYGGGGGYSGGSDGGSSSGGGDSGGGGGSF